MFGESVEIERAFGTQSNQNNCFSLNCVFVRVTTTFLFGCVLHHPSRVLLLDARRPSYHFREIFNNRISHSCCLILCNTTAVCVDLVCHFCCDKTFGVNVALVVVAGE